MPNPSTQLDRLDANQWEALYRCRTDPDHRQKLLPILQALLENPDPEIRLRALHAVARIGPCQQVGALATLVPIVATLSQSEDLLTRKTAIGCLHGIGQDHPQSAVPALINACEERQLLDNALLALIDLKKKASPALPLYHRLASHPQAKIRRLALRGLAAMEACDARSHAIIQTALQDKSQAVRQLAEKLSASYETDGSGN